MDRAEAAGFGVATAGHAALLAALAVGLAGTRVPRIQSDPIEVTFVDESAPVSTAPTPSAAPPPPGAASMPEPAPSPAPAPGAAPPARADPATQSPPRPKDRSRTGRRDPFSVDLPETDSDGSPAATSAQAVGPEVKAALAAQVRRQLKPHWKAPTGADAEKLRTELSIWLARDGSVARIEILGTTGQTASNRPQVRLHQEQAVRAARLASPFRLPPEYYDAWKLLSPIGFDKRLSQ